MDDADKKLLEQALEAIRNGELIKPAKLSLKKILKNEGLADGYFRLVAEKIEEVAVNKDLLVINGKEVDMLIDEGTLYQVEQILENYIGEQIEIYINGIKMWNIQAANTNKIIEYFRIVPKRYLCDYAEKFIEIDPEFYEPLIKTAIRSKSLYWKILYVIENAMKKVKYEYRKVVSALLVKKCMGVQHGA